MNGIGYAIEEGLRSVWRAGRSSAASIGTITVAFLTLGAFLLVSANADRVIARWSEAAEMSVYLEPEVTDAARQDLGDWLRGQSGVAAVAFVSAEQALARFRADFPELTDVVPSIGANPFPASFEVRMAEGPADAEAADRITREARGRPGVADARHDGPWLERLRHIVSGVRMAGWAIAAVLIAGAAFTVAAVVRLSLHARAAEVDIMRLVGAPAMFLRGPCLVEGAVLGGAGAALALGGLWFAFRGIVDWWGPDLAGLMGSAALRFVNLDEALWLLLLGAGLGSIAGIVASRSAD